MKMKIISKSIQNPYFGEHLHIVCPDNCFMVKEGYLFVNQIMVSSMKTNTSTILLFLHCITFALAGSFLRPLLLICHYFGRSLDHGQVEDPHFIWQGMYILLLIWLRYMTRMCLLIVNIKFIMYLELFGSLLLRAVTFFWLQMYSSI
ncbi:hypothetical protein ACJX0J_038036 [Zea mays]